MNDLAFFRYKKVLVMSRTGFKGSWLCCMAQPLVEVSTILLETSIIMWTANLLEAVCVYSVIVISIITDKVYKNRSWKYWETNELGGEEPYFCSKFCSERLLLGYLQSYFQHEEITLFDYLLAAWAHREDRTFTDWYNISLEKQDCVTTLYLDDLFFDVWHDRLVIECELDQNMIHENKFLKLECSEIPDRLVWKPKWNIQQAIEKTTNWVRAWQTGKVYFCMQRQIEAFWQVHAYV